MQSTGFNPLSAKHIKWSNTLRQFVGILPRNCLSVFDHFSGLVLKGLSEPHLRTRLCYNKALLFKILGLTLKVISDRKKQQTKRFRQISFLTLTKFKRISIPPEIIRRFWIGFESLSDRFCKLWY